MSYRTDIRNAVQAQLTGQTVAGSRVFTHLDRPLKADELPAIIIYTSDSKRGPQDYGRSLIPRLVTVFIEAAIASTADDALGDAETLAEAIEDLIDADLTLGNVVNDVTWKQSVSDVTSQGSTVLGVVLVEYEVEMLTNAKPDGAFDFNDDGFVAPPTSIETAPDAIPAEVIDASPVPPPDTACGPDGCDIDAYAGEYVPKLETENGFTLLLEDGEPQLLE